MKNLNFSLYYLQELNYRLTYTAFGTTLIFITSYSYKQGLMYTFLPQGLSHFVATGLTEIFFAYLELCAIFSAGVCFSIFFTQIYLFLRPGLYEYESQLCRNLLLGGLFFYVSLYFLLLPTFIRLLWELFTAYAQNFAPIHLTFEPKLDNYLDHLKDLIKALAMSFPLALAFFFLSVGITQKHPDKDVSIKYRGIIYILAFMAAAFVTPPDVISQTIVGSPLILFYEIQIVYSTVHKKYQQRLLVGQPIKGHKNTHGKKKESQGQW
uniref:SecY-independent transporter protein n=1 Tax=Analipus japonicus TaxID=31333 RepID=A0A8F0FD19_9PHAE|nr:SecY-independent transporter protein [Analipus japonicus]